MADRTERRDEKGLSARYLILVFLMGVAACAVFFSLGFLVGYNERSADKMAVAEEVTPTGVVPPTVNPPPEGGSAPVQDQGGPTSTDAPTERAAPARAPSKEAPAQRAAAAKTAAKATTSTSSAKTGASAQEKPVSAGFTVQVAALNQKQDAEKLVKELRGRGFGVFVVTPEFSGANDDLYRVQVGPYATREEAERIRDRIAKEGFKPYIRQ